MCIGLVIAVGQPPELVDESELPIRKKVIEQQRDDLYYRMVLLPSGRHKIERTANPGDLDPGFTNPGYAMEGAE